MKMVDLFILHPVAKGFYFLSYVRGETRRCHFWHPLDHAELGMVVSRKCRPIMVVAGVLASAPEHVQHVSHFALIHLEAVQL